MREEVLHMNNFSNKRYTIAIMLGDTQSDYSEALLRGFYTCAKEENVNILFLMGPQMPPYCTDILSCSIEGDYNYQFDTIYNYAHFLKPDALIVTYGSLSIFNNVKSKQEFLDKYADIPYLLLEELPEDSNTPYLMADNYNGMRACVEHLVCDHHYKKIAFLSGPQNNLDSSERLNAYHDVMKEHNLEVTDTMVAFGDYTEQVTEQVSRLLDLNPGLEAIACANDTMAKSCYRVCASRDLLIGKDIAITGFDDVESSRTMEPPLTSVSHSSFQFSYCALKNAISLCLGKKPVSQRMPVSFRKRSSCGCASVNAMLDTYIPEDELEDFVLKAIGSITTGLLSGIPYKKDRNHFGNLILEYFHYVYTIAFRFNGSNFHMDYLLGILKQLTAYPHVSNLLLWEQFSGPLQLLFANAKNDNMQQLLASIITATQRHIHSADILNLEQEIMDSTRKAWFVPSFSRDLTHFSSPKDFQQTMIHVLNRLKMMKVKSAYFFLFDEAVIHETGEPLAFPPEMYLLTYFTASETVYYPKNRWPCVTAENGCASFLNIDHPACLTSFILFSNAKQYGIMLCEVDQEDISFLQICSLQLGSLLHFWELNIAEYESRIELKNSLKVIQEQNHILSFISEYDELSKLLNRRGFMERALQTCEANPGKKAYLIFGDLDHLKEINDCFGHAAGDFAISAGAARLRQILPENAVTARIGGDEFISLILSEDADFQKHILYELHSAGDEFNRTSDKPYYVEFSFGIYEFLCCPQIDLNKIIQESDALLYQAKANRRASIKKTDVQS